MRKTIFASEEYYHIYNRGVEKRDIFEDKSDYLRFLESMSAFNTVEPVGSLYELSFDHSHLATKSPSESDPLVEIVAYCLNPNHFHFLLKQVAENGISQFMKRVAGGYSWYFNHRNHRSGSLFQGPFRAKHVTSNEYLLRLSAYVSLNDKVHSLGDQVAKYGEGISSWSDYVKTEPHSTSYYRGVKCSKDAVLGQFTSPLDYKKFAEETLTLIKENKEAERNLTAFSFD